MSKKTLKYKAVQPFRYPLNGIMQWIDSNTGAFELPAHAAAHLLRQGKIKEA